MAEAVRQVKPDVVVSYPITPAAEVVETLANFIADGEIDSELLNFESSGSAISGCIGASAVGGRVFAATASQGLPTMHEMLNVTAALRSPIVAGVTNQAIAADETLTKSQKTALLEIYSSFIGHEE